jgi:hypothetical protein
MIVEMEHRAVKRIIRLKLFNVDVEFSPIVELLPEDT